MAQLRSFEVLVSRVGYWVRSPAEKAKEAAQNYARLLGLEPGAEVMVRFPVRGVVRRGSSQRIGSMRAITFKT
jgi:hypothetical protein